MERESIAPLSVQREYFQTGQVRAHGSRERCVGLSSIVLHVDTSCQGTIPTPDSPLLPWLYRDCILATLLGGQLLICKERAEGGEM